MGIIQYYTYLIYIILSIYICTYSRAVFFSFYSWSLMCWVSHWFCGRDSPRDSSGIFGYLFSPLQIHYLVNLMGTLLVHFCWSMAPWQHGSKVIRLRLALWDRMGGISTFPWQTRTGSHLMLTLGKLPGLLGGDFVRFCRAIWSPSAPSAIWNHTAWWFQISMASTYCRLMFPNQMMPPTLEYSSTSIEHFFEGNLLEPARSGHQLFLAIAGFTTSCHW